MNTCTFTCGKGNSQRIIPPLPGETHFIPQAFIYSHFDSRGGSMMTTAPNIIESHLLYLNNFGGIEAETVIDEDYIGRFQVIVLRGGNELTHGTDLLETYIAGRLQTRWYSDHDKKWSDWQDKNVLLLCHPAGNEGNEDSKEVRVLDVKIPAIKSILQNQTEYRFVQWELGEDAFGLYYLPSESMSYGSQVL